MSVQFIAMSLDAWVANYVDTNRDLLIEDPEYADWLAREYLPIAGGWQY